MLGFATPFLLMFLSLSIGTMVPDIEVATLDGGKVRLGALRGQRVLIFTWASWWQCREQLPGLQRFWEENKGKNFQVLAIAMDAQGPSAAKPYYENSSSTFIRGIDRADGLWETFDFDVIPNGFFIDEQGLLLYQKIGGFDIRNDKVRSEMQALIDAPSKQLTATPAASPPVIGSNEARALFARGVAALERGDKKQALKLWRQALRKDPENFVIRKQIWAVEHPEQFYPAINTQWQREQLQREKKQP